MNNNSNRISRRMLLGGVAATTATFAVAPVSAQNAGNWPNHPVRLIVPYPAGGSTDVLFRILADRLKDKLGQSFVVENKPGASGNIGIDVVAKSTPDGYTVGCATVGHFSINQFLIAKMPYAAEKDLVSPSLTYELPNVAVVAAKHVPAKTLPEFVAWAKARPNGISIGSPGPGTTPHLSGVLFAARTGINTVHVPFRGAAQTIPAMLSGDVTFAVDNLASYISQIESGAMRALAVTSEQRWPTLPDVPTMAEAGVKDFVVTSWAAYVFPAGTPQAVVERLSATHKEIAADAAMQKRFLAAGARLLSSTPAEVQAFAAKETKMWQEVVRLSGLKPQ
jgi:tripartite-type tricarboxylate transporter receptor subunit TctC